MFSTSSQFRRLAAGTAGLLLPVALLVTAVGAPPATAQTASNPTARTPVGVPSETSETSDLAQKRGTLLAQARDLMVKLDEARRQLAAKTPGVRPERIERLEEEINERLAELSVTETKLAEVAQQMADAHVKPPARKADEKIVPGEMLRISVAEDRSWDGVYQVRRGGYVIMPQIGRVAVAGKTFADAAAAIQRALQSTQMPKATVKIDEENARVEDGPLIYLSGEFRDPRPWHFPHEVPPTLVNAILASGGITEKADLTRVRLMRIVDGKSKVEDLPGISQIIAERRIGDRKMSCNKWMSPKSSTVPA